MAADRALGAGLVQPAMFNSKDRRGGFASCPQATRAPGFPETLQAFYNEVKCAVAAEHYQTAISTFGSRVVPSVELRAFGTLPLFPETVAEYEHTPP